MKNYLVYNSLDECIRCFSSKDKLDAIYPGIKSDKDKADEDLHYYKVMLSDAETSLTKKDIINSIYADITQKMHENKYKLGQILYGTTALVSSLGFGTFEDSIDNLHYFLIVNLPTMTDDETYSCLHYYVDFSDQLVKPSFTDEGLDEMFSMEESDLDLLTFYTDLGVTIDNKESTSSLAVNTNIDNIEFPISTDSPKQKKYIFGRLNK